MKDSCINFDKIAEYYHQIDDEPVEITISKTGVARFRMNGMKPTYVNLQTGCWVEPTEEDIFDTVPIIVITNEMAGKSLQEEWK